MTIRAITIRHKGQMTLPADIRKELGVKDGGRLLLERRGNEWVLVRADHLVDRTAGALAEYARNVPPMSLDEMREAIVKSIAEENLETLRQIERDRESH